VNKISCEAMKREALKIEVWKMRRYEDMMKNSQGLE